EATGHPLEIKLPAWLQNSTHFGDPFAPIQLQVDCPKVENAVERCVLCLDRSDIPYAQLHARRVVIGQSPTSSLHHLRVEIYRRHRRGAKPFEDNLHSVPATATDFEHPSAVNPPTLTFQPKGIIPLP